MFEHKISHGVWIVASAQWLFETPVTIRWGYCPLSRLDHTHTEDKMVHRCATTSEYRISLHNRRASSLLPNPYRKKLFASKSDARFFIDKSLLAIIHLTQCSSSRPWCPDCLQLCFIEHLDSTWHIDLSLYSSSKTKWIRADRMIHLKLKVTAGCIEFLRLFLAEVDHVLVCWVKDSFFITYIQLR